MRKEIGLDIGTNTGVALAIDGVLKEVFSTTILGAFDYCLEHKDATFRIEDARKLKFDSGNKARLQGAGSVKRDANIWEEFMERHGLKYFLIDPRQNIKKVDAARFKKMTGWVARTNEHGRDAAMMVFRRTRNY